MEFSLTCLDAPSFHAHCFTGFSVPTLFVPGAFPADVVGGFHHLTVQTQTTQWQCQARIVWFAADSVAPPFCPGVGLGLLEPPAECLADWHAMLQQPSPRLGLALLQSESGGPHDRFPLPS